MKRRIYDHHRWEALLADIQANNSCIVNIPCECHYPAGEPVQVGIERQEDTLGLSTSEQPLYVTLKTCIYCGHQRLD